MKSTLLLPLLAAFALPPAPTPPGDCQPGQCIPDGDSCQVCHSAHFPQLPENGWVEGGPEGQELEDDDTSCDDAMGMTEVTCTPTEPTETSGFDCTSCGTVTNEGGELKGPNGVTQNGFPEGDCIEVKVEIKVKYCQWNLVPSVFGPLGSGYLKVTCNDQKSTSDPVNDICPCSS